MHIFFDCSDMFFRKINKKKKIRIKKKKKEKKKNLFKILNNLKILL